MQNLILKKVLIAPLDWGLGHATRCIPIIKQLQSAGCEVTIAASGKVLALLKTEFPGILALQLFGYNIRYTAQKRFLPAKILLQSPKILLTIQREHIWLKKAIRAKNFDFIISDNRFGLYSDKVPCVFITHQLLIKAPFSWLERLMQIINYRFINKFTICWVPDFAGQNSIAAVLSHPKKMPALPVKYIGPLSRFSPPEHGLKKYDWLIILSGPEPQRSILENKLLGIAKSLGTVLLVRGKPGENGHIEAPDNVTVANHLSTSAMQQAFGECKFVMSRCGYTTVMEVLALQKKAFLIPTPGQTEQEYLAKHLFEQQWCYCCNQDDDLLMHFAQASAFDYRLPSLTASSLEEAVKEIVG